MSEQQQSQEVASEEVRIQKLIDRIDKNSEGWEAIQNCKDALYRRFLAGATTDNEYKIDSKELEDFMELEVLRISAKFEPSDRITSTDISDMILFGTQHEWEKRTTKVADNITLGSQALSQLQESMDIWKHRI